MWYNFIMKECYWRKWKKESILFSKEIYIAQGTEIGFLFLEIKFRLLPIKQARKLQDAQAEKLTS